ncbi:MAG: CPBP family intramembrane metalloprotease [Chloroflexi bacterium]|nr:CPBP family intramembrane metalloprotease [Chloroflexota bacterium]
MSPLFIIGLLLVLSFMSFATFRTGQLLHAWVPEENIALLPFENLARLGLIGLLLGLGWSSGRGASALGWLPSAPAADVGLGLLAGLGLSLALLPPTLWVRRHRPQWYSDVVMRSIRPRTARQWPLVILALIPMAVMEELLFRSLLLGGFAPYVQVIYFAVAVSILFGLLHLPQGEWGVVAVTLVGLALSALFLWRNSLLLVVVAHWIANVLQLAQAALFAE